MMKHGQSESTGSAGWEAHRAHERHHQRDMDYLVGKMETFSLSQIAMTSVMFEALEEIMDHRFEQRRDSQFHE